MPESDAERPANPSCHVLCAGAVAGYGRLLALHARPGGPPFLTREGEAYVRELVQAAAGLPIPGQGALPPRPRWDPEARQLWLDGRVIKSFRQPAPFQSALLAAFEESGWAAHIDDPIPPEPGDDERAIRARLHDTVKYLNRGVPPGTIGFRGDGTGEGVCWALCQVREN